MASKSLLLREIRGILSDPLEGVHLIFNENNLFEIQAVIDGPVDTPYEKGKFRVKLLLDKEYPHSAPKGYFLTKIFHPNVSLAGEICVNTLKKDWSPNLGISHILLTIKCLLIEPNPESALNEDAGKLLLQKYDEYAKRARLMTTVHAMAHFKGTNNEVVDINSGEDCKDKNFVVSQMFCERNTGNRLNECHNGIAEIKAVDTKKKKGLKRL
ncbi:ubiquitin-conjugating enzyme E2 S-like [Zophobas morio]|jgi:ubiquitin-conjugating enzyme E2 S|uniref:ubiquitin-conjugating enzyme E2 S-like n=1 Tax=Zophobas morio TaxID=2755281 RepID=UPI0030828C26